MQRLFPTVAVPAAVAAGVLLLVPTTTAASSGGAPAGPGREAATTLTFVEKIVGFTQLDVGSKGVSRGDSLVVRTQVVRNGKVVGTGGGECVSVRPKAGTLGLTHCDYSVLLPDGQVTVQGFYDVTKPSGVIPLVGGSGKYRGATGEYAFREAGSADVFDVTLRFTT